MRGECRLYFHSALRADWDVYLPLGIFQGVDVDPVALRDSNEACTVQNIRQMAQSCLQHTEEFLCSAWGSTKEEMYKNGMDISSLDRDRIVIKVPATETGIQAANQLVRSGTRVCLAGCNVAQQALVAAGVGAAFIGASMTPDSDSDENEDFMEECERMQSILNQMESDATVIVSDVEDTESLACFAYDGGVTAFSLSAALIRDLISNPDTERAAAKQEEAAMDGKDDEAPDVWM